MNDFPYIEATCDLPTVAVSERGADYKIKNYNRLRRGDLFGIKEALSNEKPVVAGMYVYPDFYFWEGNGVYEVTDTDEDANDYHAVTIVGYDDSKEALKIFNSWLILGKL